jgi:hypothetical protein
MWRLQQGGARPEKNCADFRSLAPKTQQSSAFERVCAEKTARFMMDRAGSAESEGRGKI